MTRDHLITRLCQWSEKSPDKELYRFVDGKLRIKMTYSYGEMERRTRELAAHLQARGGDGLQKGDRVLLVFAPSPSFIVTFLACLRAGLVAVPVYPPDPTRMRQHLFAFSSIAQSSGARVALTHGEYHAAKKLAGARAAFTSVFSSKKRTGDWPELEWINVDAYTVGNTGSAARGPAAAYASLDAWQAGDVAFLQYTSGSTAEPKGVMVTHGSLAHNLDIIVKNLRASPATVVSSWLPQYHDMGLIGSLCGALYCGGSGGYLSPIDFIRDPTAWIRLTSQIGGTHLQTPNFGLKLAARKWVERRAEATFGKPDLSTVRHIFNAAEPVTASAIDTFYRVFGPYGLRPRAMRPGYGLAESTVYVVDGGNRIVRCDLDALESDGRAIVLAERPVVVDGSVGEGGGWVPSPEAVERPNARTVELVALGAVDQTPDVWIVVVDRKDGNKVRSVRDLTVGEVWVQSASVAAGYWGKEQLTTETFHGLLVGGPLRQGGGAPDMRSRVNKWMVAGDDAGEGKEEADADGQAGSPLAAAGAGASPPIADDQPAAPQPKQVPPPAMDRWLCTGDLGFLYKGHLYLTGRSKDLIVLRGRNHYPQDLEGTAEAVGEQGQAAATGVAPGALRPGCSAAFAVPRHIAHAAAARLGVAPARGQGDEADAAEALVLVCEPRKQDLSPAQQQQLFRSINDAISTHHGLSPTLTLLLGHHQAVKTSSGKIARRWNVRELERVANGDPESRWDPRKKAVVAARCRGIGMAQAALPTAHWQLWDQVVTGIELGAVLIGVVVLLIVWPKWNDDSTASAQVVEPSGAAAPLLDTDGGKFQAPNGKAATGSAAGAVSSGRRLIYLDNLRAFLTVTVVIHHTACVFGGGSFFYTYLTSSERNRFAWVGLQSFLVMNQAYFMALFFFISGWTAPRSFDKKGPIAFLRDKLRRLGLPVLVWYFVLGPLMWVLINALIFHKAAPWGADGTWMANGPPWFLLWLLMFHTAFAMSDGPALVVSPPPLSWLLLLGVAFGVLRSSTSIQMYDQMPLMLSFVLPYALFFVGGIAARRNRWLEHWSERTPARTWWLLRAIALFLVVEQTAFQGILRMTGTVPEQDVWIAFWLPATYFFQGLMLIVFPLVLLDLFRRFGDGPQSCFAKLLSRSAYATFVIHPLFIVALFAAFVAVLRHAGHLTVRLDYPGVTVSKESGGGVGWLFFGGWVYLTVTALVSSFAMGKLLTMVPLLDRVL